MTERLSAGDLNRTLLARQHLLERSSRTPLAMVEHLLGLQAQATLPPYLSLAARLDQFDPRSMSRGLGETTLVRMYTLRGTVHLMTPRDAAATWRLSRAAHRREVRASQNLDRVRHLPGPDFDDAVTAALAGGALPVGVLGERLAETWPDLPARQLAALARATQPLVQLPPRGQWRASGGVVYDRLDTWAGTGSPDPEAADEDPEAVAELVRRYLTAFGPATAADLTTWSGATGLAAVVKAMPDLVQRRDAEGKLLYDIPDAPLLDATATAPVRLLGVYDNLWLSHAGRDRVTARPKRKKWMGANGGTGGVMLVDGWLEGLWRVQDDRPVVVELFRDLTRSERSGLDEELDRVTALLAVPAR